MKATGIVRRIDDLGRICLPKELRKVYGIAEGDPLEVFTDGGLIVLRKYDAAMDISKELHNIYARVGEDLPADKSEAVRSLLRAISEVIES